MYFSSPVLFEIPVRPRIRKFIHVHLADAQGRPQPMLVSTDSKGASLMLWALAQSEKVQLQLGWRRTRGQQLADGAGRIIAPEAMTDSLGVAIHEFHRSRHQYLLNYAELETFSSWVDYLIRNELIYHCQQLPDLTIIDRIKSFCDRYDFSEDDIAEETLRQIDYRFRTQRLGEYRSFDVRLAATPQFTAYMAA